MWSRDSIAFVASGQAPSTAEAPFKDIGMGVREAITNLQNITGAPLLGAQDNNLIAPSQPDGSGVDAVVATVSAGPAVKTVVVGLLPDVSLQSARRLAESTYSRVVDTLDLSDHRKPDSRWTASSVPARPGPADRRHGWRRLALHPKDAGNGGACLLFHA
jgi:hypothetical protein